MESTVFLPMTALGSTDKSICCSCAARENRASREMRMPGRMEQPKNSPLARTALTVVAVPNTPGGLAPVLALLAEGNIDIEYMYSLFARQGDQAYMVFRISDEEQFCALLKSNGIEAVDAEELGIK